MSKEANIINHEGSSHGNNSWLASDKRSKEDEKYLARWKCFTIKKQDEKLLNFLYGFSQDLQKQQQKAIEQARNANFVLYFW